MLPAKKEGTGGFTLIELIVVIVVIGILAGFAIVGFSQFQADSRDARRSANVTTIAESLEKFYDVNGEYPSCAALSGAAATTRNTLGGIDQQALTTPSAPSDETNSIKCTSAGNILTTSGIDFFEYQGDGSSDCNGSGSCLAFTIRYKDEGSGQIKTLASRRNTAILTSGSIKDLNATATGFSTIALSWSAIQNASSYVLQSATNGTFTAGLIETTVTTNSSAAASLTPGSTYYYRVKPIGAGTEGAWSNTDNAITRELTTPVITATANSGTQVTVSWPSVTYAANYRIQRSTTNAFPTGATTLETTQVAGSGTQTKVYTDESPGATKFYRVQAYATGDTSNWSNIATMTPAATPAAFTITQADPQYNLIRSTSNAVCTAGTTPYYRWYKNNVYWTEGTGAGLQTVDAYFPQWDYTLTVTNEVRCQTATYQSPYVGAANSNSRSLISPSGYIGNDQYRSMSWDGTCPSGTTSWRFDWNITGGVNTSGSTTNVGGRYTNTGIVWGSGRGYVTLHCYSPGPWGWGDITMSTQGGFGPDCLPMTAACPP
ncbi:fibronectin type III domain-containing protein [Candidatus Saccharibacteria bacterium]|nr:fibronectin type III domain-containing protein [Candidatus Saccharibacteria bacterium]